MNFKKKILPQRISKPVLFFLIIIILMKANVYSTQIVTEIKIDVNSQNKTEYYKQMAEDLIYIDVSDTLSKTALQNSLDALKLSGKFKNINADINEISQNEIHLIISLTPHMYIENIEISGNYPVFESAVLNGLSIYEGDVYDSLKIEKQKEILQNLFKNKGFFNSKIIVETELNSDKYYNVHFIIEKGDYYSLNDFTFKGNEYFSDTVIKLDMKTWRKSLLFFSAGRFIEKDLSDDIKELLKDYREAGFTECVIEDSVSFSKNSKTADIILNIKEGPKYEPEFIGNEEFSDGHLKDLLEIYSRENKNNSAVRSSVRNITDDYKKQGYMNPEIKVSDEIKNSKKILKFNINEGVQTIVKSVKIKGNSYFTDDRIKQELLTSTPGFFGGGFFNRNVFKDDLTAVRGLYNINGFKSAAVSDSIKFSSNKKEADITIYIDEGIQTKIKSISLNTNEEDSTDNSYRMSESEFLDIINHKSDLLFSRTVLNNYKNRISAAVSEKGYPYNTVEWEAEFSEDRAEADIIYKINYGTKAYMGSTFISGNFKTKESAFKKEMKIEKDESFSLRKMAESQRNIRDMGLFRRVSIKTLGLKEKESRINLLIDVEEKKPYYIEIGTGYESDKGFYSKIKVGDKNFLGLNRHIYFSGSLSETEKSTEIGVHSPRFFVLPHKSLFVVFWEEKDEFNQDFTVETYGTSLFLSRNYTNHISSESAFGIFRKNKKSETDIPDSLSHQFEPRNVFFSNNTLVFDSRDSATRPKKGILSSVDVEFSKGLTKDTDNLLRIRGEFRTYFTMFTKMTTAFMVRGGHILSYSKDKIVPEEELFFLGGISDIRGYDENMFFYDGNGNGIGGESMVLGSLELRFDIGMNLEPALFFDSGKIFSLDDNRKEELKNTIGGGLRYITPIGPIGVIYGHKLNESSDESQGRFYFSFGYSF